MAGSMPIVKDLSLPTDQLTPEDKIVLESAPYASSEKAFLSLIILFSIIGLLANLLGFFTLFRLRKTWDNEKCYLTALAVCDIMILVGGLIFFIVPFAHSPVSYDVPFRNCWYLIGFLLDGQVMAAWFTVAIALEAYWRVCYGNSFPGGELMSRTLPVAVIVMLGLVTPFLAAPSIFEQNNKMYQIKWPDKPKYEDFPQNVTVCPATDYSSFQFIVFHDLFVFWIPISVIIVAYRYVIRKITSPIAPQADVPLEDAGQTSQANDKGSSDNRGEETVKNLLARIIVYILCHGVARVYNFTDACYRLFNADRNLLPLLSTEYEVLQFILRMFLFLQPVFNPFVYFFGRKHLRPLVAKAFKRD